MTTMTNLDRQIVYTFDMVLAVLERGDGRHLNMYDGWQDTTSHEQAAVLLTGLVLLGRDPVPRTDDDLYRAAAVGLEYVDLCNATDEWDAAAYVVRESLARRVESLTKGV